MPRTMKDAPILLCCATHWEAFPFIRRWRLRAAGPFRWEGGARGVDVAVLKTGMGTANVREALACASAPRWLVSTGFAGALQPGLASGDLVLEVNGLEQEIPRTARALASARAIPLHFGRIAQSDRPLCDPKDKAALGLAERCCAVDMESHEIRQAAERLNCPFLGARVILDDIDERLPAEAPSGETAAELLPYALRHFLELPLLARLAWRQRGAMSRLALFLEELLPSL
ncbi:MAG: hypothetical protein KGO96_03370 [Elusimicrobia bacterium]|nr:hypothetical protein [Elusimicrobiota bacterium]MDE2237198.1 hypothetical protein [Elusimicrobiota bacterium]MDE2424932.1 hypothetical protein [Elusimicrobiota bacterium]